MTEPRTVGVEEELLLVHPTSGLPIAVAGAVLAHDSADAVGAELQQQQIETETRPCTTLAEVQTEIGRWRRQAAALARDVGAAVAPLGTSPLPVAPTATPKPRYLRMVEHFGLTTVEQLTCGCHVHVQVVSADEAVGVLDRIRPWLPVLLALTANSPYWSGLDSGYASYRSQAWARFPTAGPTDVFGSAAAYEARVQALLDTGVVLDRHMVYFDARHSDRYPTVEVRVADVCLDAADAVTLAGLVRGLVTTAAEAWEAGDPATQLSTELLRLASWRAGRSGLAGVLLDPLAARPRPARAVVDALLAYAEPGLGPDREAVSTGVATILERGNGAVAQRRIAGETGDLAEVVRRATTYAERP